MHWQLAWVFCDFLGKGYKKNQLLTHPNFLAWFAKSTFICWPACCMLLRDDSLCLIPTSCRNTKEQHQISRWVAENLTMVALKHVKLPIRSTKNTTRVSQQQLSSLPLVGAPLAISNSRLTKFLPSPVVSQLPGPTQFKENARPLELKAKADLEMSGMFQKHLKN